MFSLSIFLSHDRIKKHLQKKKKPIETEENRNQSIGRSLVPQKTFHGKGICFRRKGAKKAVAKVKKGKAKRRLVTKENLYPGHNNTVVTITDTKGEVIAWSSAGSNGFK